ncbi:hypothetical protein [Pelagicoccus sp. SDUM812003]|uniref:hypothetical protein n=1 Tax=Pelagicoccus sp. SDUM812003 TaxID=3041267 RepID=UPI00280FFED0|nr:hypothetical protein [Pelagicoccus sp. SDUM812003]MDQ8202803.1 hypothetical protein [Pelagicoccus sp. SDUM812003]
MNFDSQPIERLLPHRIVSVQNRILTRWINGTNLDLSAGFFEDSAKALPSMEQNATIGPLDSLLSATRKSPNNLAGVIYHCGRCGSTLLCQMLKQHPNLIVVSEPPILGDILALPNLSHEQRVDALRAVFSVYGEWARSRGGKLVVKLTSWILEHRNVVDSSIPKTPKLLLFRSPVPVIESLSLGPPAWLLARLGKDSPSRADLANAAVATYLSHARHAVDMAESSTLRFVDYEEISSSLTAILNHFALPKPSESSIAMMLAQNSYYAKRVAGEQPPYVAPSNRCAQETETLVGSRSLEAIQAAYSHLKASLAHRRI